MMKEEITAVQFLSDKQAEDTVVQDNSKDKLLKTIAIEEQNSHLGGDVFIG